VSDVIRLVTAAERAAAEQVEYENDAHAEAVAMLERALAFVKERKVGAVAIAVALDDGGYGHFLPVVGNRIGHLAGAIADMQWNLLLKTNA
jgi:hypothetical protein